MWRIIPILALALLLSGCLRGGSLITRTGGEDIDGTMASYYATDSFICLVVWHDLTRTGQSGGGRRGVSQSSPPDVTEITGDEARRFKKGMPGLAVFR